MRNYIIYLSVFLARTAGANDNVELIETEARAQGMDPKLAVAIATVESGLNPDAVGALGELGLFQLRPEYHDAKPGERKHNVRVAITYLRYVREKCADYPELTWVNCYNHGPYKRVRKPLKFPYYEKVYKHYLAIKE